MYSENIIPDFSETDYAISQHHIIYLDRYFKYISEKIVDSLIAGTIPIYYGDYLIDEYINPKVYILIKGEKDIPSKIEYIKKIDNDERLYNSILKEKIFINDNHIDIVKKTEKESLSFFKNIFSQDKKNAGRIDDINKKYNCKI